MEALGGWRVWLRFEEAGPISQLDLRGPWDETNELEDASLFTCVTETNEVFNRLADV